MNGTRTFTWAANYRRNIAVAVTLTCLASGFAIAQTPAMAPAETPEVMLTRMIGDRRLRAESAFSFKRAELRDVLQLLGKQTGVPLSVAPDVAGRRVNVFFPKPASAAEALAAVARAAGLTWREQGAGYALYQSEPARRNEERAVADSERRERRFAEAQIAALKDRLAKAKAQGAPATPTEETLLGLVDALPPDTLQQALEGACDTQRELEARTDGRHLADRFFFPTRFSDMPAPLQGAARRMFADYPLWQGKGGDGMPAEISDGSARIGVVAAFNGLRVGVLLPDGSLVSAGSGDVSALAPPGDRFGTPQYDYDPDLAVRSARGPGAFVDLRGTPDELRRRPVRLDRAQNRNELADLLESVATQAGVPLAGEDFLSRRQVSSVLAMTGPPEDTLEAILGRIGQVANCQFRYERAILVCESVTPGLDRRHEPPAGFIDLLRRRVAAKEPPSLEEVTAAGALTRLQLQTLRRFGPDDTAPRGPLLAAVLDRYAPIHFFAGLPPAQRQAALGTDGLRLSELTPARRRGFRLLAMGGEPDGSAPDAKDRWQPARLYARPAADAAGGVRSVALIFVPERRGAPPARFTYRLPSP